MFSTRLLHIEGCFAHLKAANSIRHIHLEGKQVDLYLDYLERKRHRCPPSPPSPPSIPQELPAPQISEPRIYDRYSSTWVSSSSSPSRGIDRGSLLRLVSWNINFQAPGPGARVAAILEYLAASMGNPPKRLAVMLQEVCQDSLCAILQEPWVQRNFVLSNTTSPSSQYSEIPGDTFSMRSLLWKAAPYFTVTLASKDLAISDCFRVYFDTDMGRDALITDILIKDENKGETRECIRLCNTHLESFWTGSWLRPIQLSSVSSLLKGGVTLNSRIVAGIVGGDMNAFQKSEHEYHRAPTIDLKDVLEDTPPPSFPTLKPFQKDLSYGRARGNTWGYQSDGPRGRQRLDKFLYTGALETVALDEAQDTTGRLGRMGIGLKTEIEAWEHKFMKVSSVRGQFVIKPAKEYISDKMAAILQRHKLDDGETLVRTTTNAWASDHFGIAVGVKVL